MQRKHFLERLERENNYQKEYEKLEALCAADRYSYDESRHTSINDVIGRYFWNWKDRGNYTTFTELREQLGFPLKETDHGSHPIAKNVNIDTYFSFCEMIMTLMHQLYGVLSVDFKDIVTVIMQTIYATVEKAGFEIRPVGNEEQIVEKDAVAIAVADIVEPELADAIIEYNHYLLKGQVDKKKRILRNISDALEPKRKTLNGINQRLTDDYFDLVNNMNIRHNNLDPSDSKNYNPKFAKFSLAEQEEWYDLIYQQALTLFVLLEQQERNLIIKAYKQG